LWLNQPESAPCPDDASSNRHLRFNGNVAKKLSLIVPPATNTPHEDPLVIPAKAGIPRLPTLMLPNPCEKPMDSGFRRNDGGSVV